MEKPVFTSDKPLYIYLKELREYTLYQNEKNYDLILEFINNSTNMKLGSLLDFKNIDIEKIDGQKFYDVLDEYRDKLEKELNIKITSDKLVNVISLCVESLDYSVHRKKVILKKKQKDSDSPEDTIDKKKLFLSIKNKPKVKKTIRNLIIESSSSDSE